ncbi:MAG: GAF domain-containing protein [Devosia sp.]
MACFPRAVGPGEQPDGTPELHHRSFTTYQKDRLSARVYECRQTERYLASGLCGGRRSYPEDRGNPYYPGRRLPCHRLGFRCSRLRYRRSLDRLPSPRQGRFRSARGGEPKVETTLCNEVRQRHDVVVIENVAEDAVYANHHTPWIYGLRNYISVPIMLPDGTFFGTLRAIHPSRRT